MAVSDLPSVEVIRNLLAYDPATGILLWRQRSSDLFTSILDAKRWNARFAGKAALTSINAHGYCVGRILGVAVAAHRVIWAIVYGAFPKADIDHDNGVRSDNRLSNIKDRTRSQNGKNQRLHVTNKSGTSGVTWCRRKEAWTARITVDGSRKHLGYFDEKTFAVDARKAAEARYGFHENHGKPRLRYAA